MSWIARAYQQRKRDRLHSTIGFTLIEVLVVMAMIGILSAIAAPSWLGFANNQRLISAQSRAFSNLRLAQSSAKRNQTIWQASFRNMPDVAQYAIHPEIPSTIDENYWNSLSWQNFDSSIMIDDDSTTFKKLSGSSMPADVYRVLFKSQGSVNGQLGKITFVTRNSDRKKCVIISTLLGAMRLAENNACK
jgi:prepilin-type N-terminal cleavage/methylation domain-containing protein